jgi:hypothetical protein
MKTTKPVSWTTMALAAALALLAWITPALLVAQEEKAPPPPAVTVDRECRCVDADGNEIEGCVCVGRSLEALREGLEGLRGGVQVLEERMPELRATLAALMRRRARIGVSIAYDQDREGGAVIQAVQGGSPAAAADLRAGDVVTHVAGRSLTDPLDDADAEAALDADRPLAVQRFVRRVGDLEPDTPTELTLLRDGRPMVVEITPEPAGLAVGFAGADGTESPWVGSYRFVPEDDLPELYGLRGDSLREGLDSLRVRLRRGLEPLREMRLRFERDDAENPTLYRFQVPGGDAAASFFGDTIGWMDFRDGVWGSVRGLESLRDEPCLRLYREGADAGGLGVLGGDCIAGAELIDLNPDLGSYFGTDQGALVARVGDGSPLGLRAGDVILAIGGRDVRSASRARRILASYGDDEEIRLHILREGNEREVLGRRR